MTTKARYDYILSYFKETEPNVTTELDFGSVFQLLVAVMLSAQCTDKRVNQVTPELFRAFPDAPSLAKAEPEDVFPYIRSVSYPNAKAKHLVEMARILCEKYEGEVPHSFEELVTLPGVGRKTANVIEAVAYGKAAMPVDTHVFRVAHRLGLVPKTANTPLKVEMKLKANIPDEYMADAHHWILLHGRYICQSRKPKCDKCPFASICPSAVGT
ncbi:MAG: endonuclease III [Bacteroidaceae bacterium]|nr:endonuclease III [Bacteroidaceae bacterium]